MTAKAASDFAVFSFCLHFSVDVRVIGWLDLDNEIHNF